MKRKSYSISEFKAKSLGLLDSVHRKGETIIVTKRGKPIAKVVPFPGSSEKPEPGKLSGTILEEHDIVSPFGARLWKAAESE